MGRIAYAAVTVLIAATLYIEIKGGLENNSIGLYSDAGHLGGADAIAIALGWMAYEMRRRRGSAPWLEWLTTWANFLLLIVVAITIGYAVFLRTLAPEEIGDTVIRYAALGLIGNGAQAILTHWFEHECDHVKLGQTLHFAIDFGASAAVLFGAVMVRWTGNVYWDTVAAAIVAVVSLVAAYVLWRKLQEPPSFSGPGADKLAHLHHDHHGSHKDHDHGSHHQEAAVLGEFWIA
jgi:cobalt-zinc-cadmium efflux system protein